MSVLGGNPLLLGSGDGAAGFTTQRSVRLRSSNTAYLNRTPAGASNRKTWTWSAWVKRGSLGTTANALFALPTISGVLYDAIGFNGDALRYVATDNGSTFATELTSTAVLRDPSAWYHIVYAVNTTQAINTNRIKLYVNGIQITAFTTATYPSQNRDTAFNSANEHRLGRWISSYEDCYLTEVNFIDGQALTPSAFGEYDAVRNTQWKPKAYTGTYGTNGFYLNFSDNSNNTAATIGKDSSGNSNNWTPNGISVTAGVTYDSMTDVPTNTSPTNANYAVLNPTFAGTSGVLNGNLALGLGSTMIARSSILMTTGKWYAEFTMVSAGANSCRVGITGESSTTVANYLGFDAVSWGYTQINGVVYNNASAPFTYATYTNGDVIGVAYDADARNLSFYKNNTLQGTITSANITAGNYYFAVQVANSTPIGWACNFGQQPFIYTPPTEFLALNTYNLPDGNVTSSDDYHKIYSYTGNGGGLQVGEIQKPASLFNLDRSLRFRSSASAFLSRTPASAGNRQKWTWSAWVKRSGLGSEQILFHAYNGSNPVRTVIAIASTDQISFNIADGGYDICTTTQVFRDPAAWFHLCVSLDSTQATPADRLTIEVNGVAVAYSSSVSLNRNGDINTTNLHHISSYGSASFLNGYLADVYFVDGQKLTASNFGTYDGNFYWTPKAYTGTYGTNGFHLEFEDFSASTAAAIGKDTSGQGNNWTPNNINLTTPEVDNEYWDSYTDVPTNGSADACNYCTLDPLQPSSTGLRNGNLTAVWTAANTAFKQRATYTLSTGKWYFEGNLEAFTIGNAGNTNYAIGFITTASGVDTHVSFGWTTNGTSMKLGYRYDVAGTLIQNVTYNTVTPVATDIFGIEYDVDNGTANFYKNGTLMGSASGLALGSVNPHIWRTGTSNSATMHVNFGQRAFKYTPSTGYKKINAFNVAEVTGDLESPDFVWIKSRSASTAHTLFNSVTGVNRYVSSNGTGIEITDVNSLIQFNKNGFLIGNSAAVNTSAATYVASAWKTAAPTVTNNSGSVATQVRANPTSGISLVTFTTPASGNFTLGHGLGVAPAVVILKNRVGADSMYVYHKNLATPTTNYLALNTTALALTSASIWGSTNPTSSVVTLGTGGGIAANANGLLYCFAEIAGFSKFGSYISNNAADGPFVYTGFRPRWLMVKRAIAASGTGGWFMYDAERNTYNVMDKYIFAEGTAGEATLAVFDFTSNGFKIRSNNVHVNTTAGDTYIYMAFAEHPFKYALAR
jgi:hypothetical protein